MEASTETAVRRELTIAASPETVWEFFVDPEKATRWMGKSARLDPRPGGEYRVEVISGNVARGEFVEVDRPRRLVWTWGWEPGSPSPVEPGSTRIEVELVPDGDATVVRLAHRGPAGLADLHAAGWDNYLPRLAVAAEGGAPESDRFFERFRGL